MYHYIVGNWILSRTSSSVRPSGGDTAARHSNTLYDMLELVNWGSSAVFAAVYALQTLETERLLSTRET